MTKMSEAVVPFLTFEEQASAAATPDTGNSRIYLDDGDHLLRSVDDAGNVTVYGALSGFTWTTGTSMPGTPATNDRITRTDLGMDFYYDGTRWLSTNLFLALVPDRAANPASTGIGTSQISTRGVIPIHAGASDLWMVDHGISFFVIAGTALSGSHKWVGTFDKVDTSNASTTIVTDTINSGSSSVWRRATQAIGALVTQGTYFVWQQSWTKTGTPGNLITHEWVSYRIVAT